MITVATCGSFNVTLPLVKIRLLPLLRMLQTRKSL